MSVYNQIPWLGLGAGLTALGLILSWLTARRRGIAAGLRGAAWSLLPLAAALSGAIKMFWQMGVAVGNFAASFIFSPLVWSGVAVAGLALVLFVVSGGLRGRKAARGASRPGSKAVTPRQPGGPPLPAGQPGTQAGRKGKAAAGDDDLADVADILRKHGIR